MRHGLLFFYFTLSLALWGCAGIPPGAQAVEGFEIERYMGTWYEIARLDHSFERGLTDVTATYTLRSDGTVEVFNRGFDADNNRWRSATGRAKPAGQADVGRLKVSFFWPFYGSYNILALDGGYTHALVCGPNLSYLWILARTPDLPAATTASLIEKARAIGFETDELIFVTHERAGELQAGEDR